MEDRFRVGRNQKRVILYTETGKEYLVFPVGKEADCKLFCDFLNGKQKMYYDYDVKAILHNYMAFANSSKGDNSLEYLNKFIEGNL